MQLTRITATLGALALGGVLVASTTSVGASASVEHQRPAPTRTTTVHDHIAPSHRMIRLHDNMRMGKHCVSSRMSM
jgi:hypothetical protein